MNKKSKKRTAIILGTAGVLILVILLIGNVMARNARQNVVRNIQRYTVTRGDLSFTAIGSGKITSAQIRTVMPPGNITEIKVKAGDYVNANDELARYITAQGQTEIFKSDYTGVVTSIPAVSPDARAQLTGFEISSMDSLEIIVQVTEKQIHNIKTGQSASIYIDALNLTIDGSVSRVSMMGRTAGDFSVYDVTVSFDKMDHNIFIGMTGSARITMDTKENIIKIPMDALIERNNKKYVLKSEWINNINRPQSDYYVEIKTGLSDAAFVEVTEGNIESLEILIQPREGFTSFPRFFR